MISRQILNSLCAAALLLTASFTQAQIGQPLEPLLEQLEAYQLVDTVLGYTTTDGFSFDVEERAGAVHTLNGQGELSEANIEFAGDLLGVATAYGADISEPVKTFFRERIGELAGAGPTPLAIEQYTLSVDVTGEAAPYDVRLELTLNEISEDLFPATENVLGPEDATYVIREFSDFQCPFCAQFALGPLTVIKDELLSRGDVRFEYHHFPLVSIHPNASTAAEASECVAEAEGAEAFWTYHDALFQRQAAWQGLADPSEYFVQLAQDSGLNASDLATCLAAGDAAATVEEAYQIAGQNLGLRGTPSVFINGYRVPNFGDMQSYRDVIALIDAFSED